MPGVYAIFAFIIMYKKLNRYLKIYLSTPLIKYYCPPANTPHLTFWLFWHFMGVLGAFLVKMCKNPLTLFVLYLAFCRFSHFYKKIFINYDVCKSWLWRSFLAFAFRVIHALSSAPTTLSNSKTTLPNSIYARIFCTFLLNFYHFYGGLLNLWLWTYGCQCSLFLHLLPFSVFLGWFYDTEQN